MAQLGARLDGIEEVVGSNPIGSTKFGAADCRGTDASPMPRGETVFFLPSGWLR